MNTKDLNYLLNLIPDTNLDDSDCAVFFSTKQKIHFNYLYSLYSYILAKRNIPSFFFYENDTLKQKFATLKLNGNKITNSLHQKNQFLQHLSDNPTNKLQWEVDLKAKEIYLADIKKLNLFPAFIAVLRKAYKRYTFDFSKQQYRLDLKDFLSTGDLFLRYVKLLYDYANRNDKKLFFVGHDTQYPPNSFLCLFSEMGKFSRLLNYIDLGTRYDQYFCGPNQEFGNAVGCSNFTQRNVYQIFKGYEKEFGAFVDNISNDRDMETMVIKESERIFKDNILDYDPEGIEREKKSDPDNLIPKIEDWETTFCLFASKFHKTELYDCSDAFSDMIDWLTETISILQDTNNLLLLKPHPGEKNKLNPHRNPNETLGSFLGKSVKNLPNIELLEPRSFKAETLYNLIDCGLVWDSSVGLEMTYKNTPGIISGRPYYLPYLNLTHPESKKTYKKILLKKKYDIPSETTRRRTKYLYYFFKEHCHQQIKHINNVDYTDEDNMTDNMCWNRAEVQQLFNHDQPDVENLLLDEISLDL